MATPDWHYQKAEALLEQISDTMAAIDEVIENLTSEQTRELSQAFTTGLARAQVHAILATVKR